MLFVMYELSDKFLEMKILKIVLLKLDFFQLSLQCKISDFEVTTPAKYWFQLKILMIVFSAKV